MSTNDDHETMTMVEVDAAAMEKDVNVDRTTDEHKMVNNAETDAEKDAQKDVEIVDWDGPDDPANPRNWSKAYKLTNVVLVSLAVLYTNLATTVFAPGANVMQREFGFKSDTVEILTITMASLGFALGQLFVPSLSEVFGRVPVYRASSVFYLGFTAGCARSTNVAEFLVFRLCTGIAAASYISTGGGTVADLLPKEERGLAMALFTAGPLFGPVCFFAWVRSKRNQADESVQVIGPIIGGFVTENLSWRWSFYLILMMVSMSCLLFIRISRS